MKRYTKNPEQSEVFIPGVGKLTAGQILTGVGLEKFVPTFLVEVPDAVASLPLESAPPVAAPVLLTEPAPTPMDLDEPGFAVSVPPPAVEEEESADKSEAPAEEKRPRGRPKKIV